MLHHLIDSTLPCLAALLRYSLVFLLWAFIVSLGSVVAFIIFSVVVLRLRGIPINPPHDPSHIAYDGMPAIELQPGADGQLAWCQSPG